MTGAAHLVAAAAQRAGAGMVRLGSPGVADDPGRPAEAVGLAAARGRGGRRRSRAPPPRFQALVIGPGLGTASPTAAAILDVLAATAVPPWSTATLSPPWARDVVAPRGRARRRPCSPRTTASTSGSPAPTGPDRLAAARASPEAGAVVLLKGPTTVVAAPGGGVRIVTPATPAWPPPAPVTCSAARSAPCSPRRPAARGGRRRRLAARPRRAARARRRAGGLGPGRRACPALAEVRR